MPRPSSYGEALQGRADGRVLAQALCRHDARRGRALRHRHAHQDGQDRGHLVRGDRAGARARSRDRRRRRSIYPRDRPPVAPVAGSRRRSSRPPAPLDLPPLPKPHRLREVVRPSTASKPADVERVYETAAEAAYDADTARKRGIALHALLQHLPQGRRAPTGTPSPLRALAALLPTSPSSTTTSPRKAISILTQPELAAALRPRQPRRSPVPRAGPPRRQADPPRRPHRPARRHARRRPHRRLQIRRQSRRPTLPTVPADLPYAARALCYGCKPALPGPGRQGGHPLDGAWNH